MAEVQEPPTSSPAGWYADAENPGGQRYWDGQGWTDQRTATLPAPGWYPDPQNPSNQRRYWDGQQWTDQLMPQPPPSAAPASIAAGAPVAQNQDQVVYVAGTGNGLAVTALVCGIVGAVVGLIPILAIPALALGLVAFVLGILGRRKAKKDPRAGRKGAATAGIILGVIAIALGIAGLVIVNDAVNDLDRSLSSHCLNHPNAPDCP